MAQTDDDLKVKTTTLPIRERTEGERQAYQQGYAAGLRDCRKALDRVSTMQALTRMVNL